MHLNTKANQHGEISRDNKILLVVTHSNMLSLAVSWLIHGASVRNVELFVATCVLNPVAVPGRHAAWPLIENPQKVRNALKEAIESLPQGSFSVLDEINAEIPSQQVTSIVKQFGIGTVYFPVDAELDPSSPDMQFGQRLLRDVPSDVLLVDFGKVERKAVKRLIIPMDLASSGHAIRQLVKVGSSIGTVVPLHISPDFGEDSQKIALSELDLQLKEIGVTQEHSWLTPQVVISEGFHQGIMQTVNKNDAILMSGSNVRLIHDLKRQVVAFRPHISESIAIGIYRPAELAAKTFLGRIGRRIRATVPELTLADRISLFDRIQGGARLTPDFVVMMGLSVLIASFGLLADNSSVVIGAMLVAPFMTSLVGVGLALVQGNLALMKRSALAMGAGIMIGLLLSYLIGLVVPLDELPLEVLARGDPDIVDMAIAFVSGMAAAYAVSRESVAESIVGVAIAAALVPPLACVGIMASQGNVLEAEGALTLLVTNLVAIALGAAFMFRRLGVPGTRTEHKAYSYIRRISITLSIITLLLMIMLGYRMAGNLAVGQIRPMAFRVSNAVKYAVLDEVEKRDGLHLMLMGRSGSGSSRLVRILLSVDDPVPASVIEEIRDAVKSAMGKDVPVEITVLQNAVIRDLKPNTLVEVTDEDQQQ